jgi:hypothetical protein
MALKVFQDLNSKKPAEKTNWREPREISMNCSMHLMEIEMDLSSMTSSLELSGVS